PAGARDVVAGLRMLLTGTLAGALLAVDNALSLDLTSVLYPVWQAAVALRLAMVLQRGKFALRPTARSCARPSCWDESGSNIRRCRLSSAPTSRSFLAASSRRN